MNSLERLFARIFADWLPGLPSGAKEWAARLFPWVIIILGILGLLAWLGATGPAGIAAKTAGLGRVLPALAATLHSILVPLLQILAVAGGCYMLWQRRIGWRLAFCALLLGLVIHLVWFSPAGIIGDIVFAYLLFQLKPYYRRG